MISSRAGPSKEGLFAPAQRDVRGKTYFLLLATLAVGGIVQPLNMTMLVISLSPIGQGVGASSSAMSWVITAFIIAMVVAQPIGGKLVDRLDRQKAFLLGIVLFGAASALAGLSTTFPMLLFFRIAQALASAILMPAIIAIVRAELPQHRRAAAMGVIFAAYGAAGVVGPPLGGLLTSSISWRAIFFVNIPIAALAVYLGTRHVPSRPAQRGQAHSVDYSGAALFAAGLLSFILFLALAQRGSPSLPALAPLPVIGAIAVGAFVRRELRVPDPLVNLRLFRTRSFAFSNATLALTGVGMFSGFIGSSLFLSEIRGLSSGEIGLIFAVPSAAGIAIGPLGGRLADRVGRRRPVLIGTALLGLSLLMLVPAGAETPVWFFFFVLFLHGAGVALFNPVVQMAAVEVFPERQAGMASGVSATVRSTGMVLGSAMAGAAAGASLTAFRVVFLLAAVATLAALPLALGIHRHPHQRPAEEENGPSG